MRYIAEHRAQKPGSQQAAGALRGDVAGHAAPWKIAAGGKCQRDRRITHKSLSKSTFQ
jgi:hypothetical protein